MTRSSMTAAAPRGTGYSGARGLKTDRMRLSNCCIGFDAVFEVVINFVRAGTHLLDRAVGQQYGVPNPARPQFGVSSWPIARYFTLSKAGAP